MKDLIKRGQALRVSEMDSEIYLALNCLPSVEAIPIDWLLQQGKTAYASDTVEYIREAEHYNKTITDLIDKWRSERKEE